MALLAAFCTWAADFESLRKGKSMVVPEGTTIEGIITSDYRQPNSELNRNTGWNNVDLSLSHKTAYIESIDGKFGFRLIFPIMYDNRFEAGTLVRIDISGCQLTAEKGPERYTISGISAKTVTVLEKNVPIPEKKRRVAEICPEDIYTKVTLEGLEFLSKQGSFANIYERCAIGTPLNENTIDSHLNAADGWAQLLEDSDGSAIYMQVNSSCPWRRNNIGVPKGVGDVCGIIVTGDNRRYGISFGPYSIRPITFQDIRIPYEESSSFTTVVSWRWDRNYYEGMSLRDAGFVRWAKPLYGDALVAEKGSGLLYTDAKVEFGPSVEYDSRYTTDGDGLGYRYAGAIKFGGNANDWIHSYGNSSIIVETSTEGFEGKGLLFNFSMLAGDHSGAIAWGYPAKWSVEYSTDGKKYKSAGYEFFLRPLASRSEIVDKSKFQCIPYDAAMGYCEHHVALSSELMGQKKLFVRIIPVGSTLVGMTTNPDADYNSLKADGGTDRKMAIRLGMAEIKTY